MRQEYAFAKKYLESKGNKLYTGEKRILNFKGKEKCPYEVKQLKSEIIIGNKLLEENDVEDFQVIGMSTLQRMGWCVIKREVKKREKKFKGQRVQYGLSKYKSYMNNLEKMPPNHKVIFNPLSNMIKLVGNASDEKWHKVVSEEISEGFVDPFEYTSGYYDNPFKNDPILDQMQGQLGLNYEPIPDKAEIKEIPIMISNEGQVICIEQKRDMQRIAYIGDQGTGKSLGMVRTVCQIKYKFEKDWICVLNDGLSQFHTWCEPMETTEFVYYLKRVGEEPLCLPTINLYVGHPNVKLFAEEQGISFYYTIDSLEFYNKYGYYTHGIDDMDLGMTRRYLEELKHPFSKMKSAKEVKEIMEEVIIGDSGKKKDTYATMIAKFQSALKKVYRQKALTVQYDDETVAATWKVETKMGEEWEGDPIIACMKAGIIPVLNTKVVKDSKFGRNMIASAIQKLIEYKNKDVYGDNQRIWIVMDELGDFTKTRGGARDDNLTNALVQIFTQGRSQNFGFLYTIQSFGNIHQDILQNTTTMICNQIKFNTEDINKIQKSFGIDKDDAKQIKELNREKRELFAVQREPFIVYDTDGVRRKGRTFYRGYLIPPNCNTYKPKEVKNSKEEEK